jgi:uracil-DNA glycosylase family 4
MIEFEPDCRLCPRLAAFRDAGKARHPDYHCAPVPPFGDPDPRLFIVGLAPGFHGANATGRPFTGDYAGIWLYRALHEFGWSTAPESVSADDGLQLRGARITNSVKCVPPANKPTPAEIATCNRYLTAELDGRPAGTVILSLGAIAHTAVLRACSLKPSYAKFGHGAEHALPGGRILVNTYHSSRYNMNTGRLTEEMFRRVVARATELARSGG